MASELVLVQEAGPEANSQDAPGVEISELTAESAREVSGDHVGAGIHFTGPSDLDVSIPSEMPPSQVSSKDHGGISSWHGEEPTGSGPLEF